MVLKKIGLLLALLIFGGVGLSVPAIAHKEHKKQEQAATAPAGKVSQAAPGGQAMDPAMHNAMGEMMDDSVPSSMGTVARLVDWLGRLHPIIVHFPIAFFPAAFFTALIGRRRPAFAKPVQFLVVAGGVIAPVAAFLGWLDAIGADPDRLLTVHRWLGTAIGGAGLALALWAWRRPDEDLGPVMVWALAAITAAIIVQGWFGGALVHGIDHLNW
jgi:uncharacterized membrane protein